VTPQGIRLAGGKIECFGAPVEPGNLLLLATVRGTLVLGAPGCARSRQTNVIDLVLPRLLAGELLAQRDIRALGNGGLL
jgi:molybdenum cofactor cytidylyltransferase